MIAARRLKQFTLAGTLAVSCIGLRAARAEPIPSLDELLGLPESSRPMERPDRPGIFQDDPTAGELAEKLSGEQMSQAFLQAVDLMDTTADRITRGRDPGLVTQRLQRDILRTLDQLIASSSEEESSSSSSSSSSEQQQQQQPSQPQEQQQSQEPGSDGSQESTPPGAQSGQLSPELAANRAAWGALPERTREALLQGSSEPFSVLYQRLTERYYRRIAEEAAE
ncbi:MAG: hypothetical protein AAFY58_02280 [Planctomycetota bacterium]